MASSIQILLGKKKDIPTMTEEEEKAASVGLLTSDVEEQVVEVGEDGNTYKSISLRNEQVEETQEPRASPYFPRLSTSEQDILKIEDHFTLPSQSSTIRFRSSVIRVFPNNSSQFVLETHTTNEGESKTSMRRMHDSSAGSTVLRGSYTLITIFFSGTVAVFAISFIFFLVTDLTIAAGYTSIQSITPVTAAGVFLALPVVVYGLASGLVVAGSFISDTWQGNPLMKRYCFSASSEVLFEWTLFIAYLGLPIMVVCVCLLSVTPNWWEISLLTWFASVAALFVIYAFTIAYFETRVCLTLVSTLGEEDQSNWKTFLQCIVLHQTAVYAGYKRITCFCKGTTHIHSSDGGDILRDTYHERRALYTRWTMWSFISTPNTWRQLHHVLEEPFRLTPIAEIQGVRTVFSATSWNLEKVYCRPREDRLVAVVRGPDAMSIPQLRSSLACALVAKVLGLLLCVSILVYIEAGTNVILIFSAVALVFGLIPSVLQSTRLYKLFRSLAANIRAGADTEEKDTSERGLSNADVEGVAEAKETEEQPTDNPLDSDVIYLVSDKFRVTKPRLFLSWAIFAVEVGFLFVWPISSLYQLGNIVIATMFLCMAIFSFLRRYVNPATALQEVGSIKKAHKKDDQQDWRREARTSSILDDVTINRARHHWIVALALIVISFLVLCFLTIVASNNTSADSRDAVPDPNDFAEQPGTYLYDFEYLPNKELSYPSCTIGTDFLPYSSISQLIDFSFLALMGYKSTSVTQLDLDSWFGAGNATDMVDVVQGFRNVTNTLESPVSYKLIKFKDGGPAVVTIRGTAEIWDLFADAQLWSTAALMQVLRISVPFGGTWTPIMDELIRAVAFLQSGTLGKIAFYKETTAFVEFLEQLPEIDGGIMVTGHSLGGGLAMITGAQTGVPSVGISGPNALLSRKAFEPQLSEDAINRYTFNVIPDRDLVARVDDVARLKQNIKCTAPMNSLLGCHDSERTLCELMVSCGSQSRPPICKCAQDFGYPEPTPTGSRTFAEACVSSSTR
jgi:lipase ATG15